MRKQGFTMIELLVVVIIITTLTAIALPSYRRSLDRSRSAEAVQMLPALFEARERWAMLNLCRWRTGALSCPGGETLTVDKLDIDVQYSTKGTQNFTTDNYMYKLIDDVSSTGNTNLPCVSATANWSGKFRDKVTIYYQGDKLTCSDSTGKNLCVILNIPDGECGA